jgi:RNA polymerase sigma factor (TIGR02999 family)
MAGPGSSDPDDITRLLNGFRAGDVAAREQLMARLHGELRRVASHALRKAPSSDTWQPTALINEAYIRLVERAQPEWQSRTHFFAVAATIMRNILVDEARRRLSAKRGAGPARLTLNEALQWSDERPQTLVALDDALTTLAQMDARRAKVLELRFFAGLSVAETAEALGVAVATVGREMRLAEAWLARELSEKLLEGDERFHGAFAGYVCGGETASQLHRRKGNNHEDQDSEPHAANARLPVHLRRVPGDSIEALHRFYSRTSRWPARPGIRTGKRACHSPIPSLRGGTLRPWPARRAS